MTTTLPLPLPAPEVASGHEPVAVAASARDAVKTYGTGDAAVHALDGVSVDFERSRFTAIMGPSGSGKSTLMQNVAGLDTLTSGSVSIGGVDLSSLSDRQLTRLRRDRIGFVFQSFNLVPTLTAEENIQLPLDLAGRKPDAAWFEEVVATVGLGTRLHHRPAELSGANSSASPWLERWSAGPTSCSATNRPATSTAAPAARSSSSCATPSIASARPW